MAPSVSAAATVSSGTVLNATKPTANVVASGSPTASSPIGRIFRLQLDIAALQARRPQQRRQQHVEHELRVELDVLEAGNRARRQACDHQRQWSGHVVAARQRGQQDRHHQHRKQGALHLVKPPRPNLDRSASLSLVSMLKRSRGRDSGAPAPPTTCAHLSAAIHRTGAAYSRTMPGLRRAGRERVGAFADVHDMRPRRLLRFEPAPTRQRTLPRDRSPRHALGRAGRGLAMVLHRCPARMIIWQA